MTFGPVVKDVSSTLNYTIDWSENLTSETIGTSAWAATPTGLTIGTSTISSLSTTVKLSGGTAGNVYQLTNTVDTVSGIRDERSITIRVENQ